MDTQALSNKNETLDRNEILCDNVLFPDKTISITFIRYVRKSNNDKLNCFVIETHFKAVFSNRLK